MRVALFIMAVAGAVMPVLANYPAVAKWDVIPCQRVRDGVFNAGVVAFHEKALKVEFRVDGKIVHTAEEKTLNERTGVKEYVFPFDPAKFGTGPRKLAASVTTKTGRKLELPEIELFSDPKSLLGSPTNIYVDCENGIDYADGSEEEPVQTLKAAIRKCGDGGTIYCKKGVYTLHRMGGGFKRRYWTTIRPVPGLSKGDVKIRGGRPATDLLRFKDVDIFIDVSGEHEMVVGGEGSRRQSRAWFDNCRIYNRRGAAAADTYPFGNRLTAYVTGGVTAMLKNGPCNASIIRNHRVVRIASEALSGNDMLVLNCKVEGVDPGTDTEAHPALFAGCAITPEWLSDIVFCNVSIKAVRCDGILAVRMRNSAFVNVTIDSDAAGETRFSDRMDNVYFKNVVQKNLDWDWHQGDVKKAGAFIPLCVRAYGCKAKSMFGFPTFDGSQGLLVDEGGLTDDFE